MYLDSARDVPAPGFNFDNCRRYEYIGIALTGFIILTCNILAMLLCWKAASSHRQRQKLVQPL